MGTGPGASLRVALGGWGQQPLPPAGAGEACWPLPSASTQASSPQPSSLRPQGQVSRPHTLASGKVEKSVLPSCSLGSAVPGKARWLGLAQPCPGAGRSSSHRRMEEAEGNRVAAAREGEGVLRTPGSSPGWGH